MTVVDNEAFVTTLFTRVIKFEVTLSNPGANRYCLFLTIEVVCEVLPEFEWVLYSASNWIKLTICRVDGRFCSGATTLHVAVVAGILLSDDVSKGDLLL